jgi:hypothetical protein
MFYYGFDRKGKARDFLAVGRDPFHFYLDTLAQRAPFGALACADSDAIQ